MMEIFFILDSREPLLSKSILCGSRWASKTSVVLDFYKKCMLWLELEICCADLKSFIITLHSLRNDRDAKVNDENLSMVLSGQNKEPF